MRLFGIVFTLCLKILCVENRDGSEEEISNEVLPTTMTLKDLQKTTLLYDNTGDTRDFRYPLQKKESKDFVKKSCSVIVSGNPNAAMQSLLRKYRYDANGVLIPGSVKYYIKMPQRLGSAPILVPLTGKAFSPLGGFVRYYKEVPPIPPSLQNSIRWQ